MATVSWQKQSRLGGRNTQNIEGVKDIVGEKRGKKIMSAFIDIMILKWNREIRKMNIGKEGDLSASFTKSVKSGADQIHGRSRFNFYGRMVDMGVGKGITLQEQKSGIAATRSRVGGSLKRKPKPWYSNVWLYERNRIGEVYRDELAKELAKQTKEQFENPN